MASTARTETFEFLRSDGEMAGLLRSFDWSGSPLGPPENWPKSLRSTLGIVMHSAFPMFLFWGKELTCFYNDAFRPSLGIDGKHPALGKKGREVWSEIWDFIGPLIEQVMTTGKPVWFEDQLVPFYRNGRMEDIYWTFSYSPAFGDDGEICGVFVTCTETTAKVNMVSKLRESENHFRILIAEATVGIIVLKGERQIVEVVNDAYGRLINRRVDELLGNPLFNIIPEAEEHFKPIIEKVRLSKSPVFLYDHPYFVLVNGEQKHGYLNLVYQPYHEGNEEVTGVMILCQDVTQQVLAHKKVEETQQQLRSIVESAPFPIGVYVGREMRIELANQSIIDAWGKGNDVVGKKYADVLPELHNQKIYSQLDHVFVTGVPYHARNQRVDLLVDGRLKAFYFNYSFTPLRDAEGNVYGVMNTAADVSDLNVAKQKVEQSERNFRNMILQSPVAMCIMTGPKYVVEVANEAMIKLWGKEPADVIQKPFFDGLPDTRAQGLEELIEHVYRTGESYSASERPINLLREGRMDTVYQNFVYEAYRGVEGEILGVLAISVDVTEQVLARRKIEEVVSERTKELAVANSELQNSNAELAQFAYIASHDLQEPLRKIRTFAQMLENSAGDKLGDSARSYLHKISNASSRMHTLVRDVLTYSELVKREDVFVDVDLNEIFENVKADFELLIEQKEATVISETLPAIEAIPLQMTQLFGNLMGNALKFSRRDVKPVISLSVSSPTKKEILDLSLPPEKEYCKIRFSDNGIGIKSEFSRQIFNIFQRLHRKSEFEGTGIGLAMCKKIAANHYGEITADESSEHGAVFTILLPKSQNT